MYSDFRFEGVALSSIQLDDRNPRIVTQKKLASQEEILAYLYEHESLDKFIRKIAIEGRNQGAERPYIVESGGCYVVIEGNSRIAAYKVLTGMLKPPKGYSAPSLPEKIKKTLAKVDCSIAPSRDALMPIMANAHFGLGDKSRWGFLGSRKAVYDEWQSGKTISHLAQVFDRTEGQIRDLILEYTLYLKALMFNWSKEERAVLLNPQVAFNPPIRFLETKGHKEKIGIGFDSIQLKLNFIDAEAESKFKHLLLKLVIGPKKLGATSTYEAVFKDYKDAAAPRSGESGTRAQAHGQPASAKSGDTTSQSAGRSVDEGSPPFRLKSGALFSYDVTSPSNLLSALMKEARDLNCKTFPAAGTFLLRNLIESLLKEIIHQQKANAASVSLDLEASLNLCMSDKVLLSKDDGRILKEFKSAHLNYLNLGSHGNVTPNYLRLIAARDCIDQFVKRNI